MLCFHTADTKLHLNTSWEYNSTGFHSQTFKKNLVSVYQPLSWWFPSLPWGKPLNVAVKRLGLGGWNWKCHDIHGHLGWRFNFCSLLSNSCSCCSFPSRVSTSCCRHCPATSHTENWKCKSENAIKLRNCELACVLQFTDSLTDFKCSHAVLCKICLLSVRHKTDFNWHWSNNCSL